MYRTEKNGVPNPARMSRTLKDFVFAAVMFLMMQFRCRICSVRAKVLCVGSEVFGAWEVFSQQPPKAKRGIGGRKILSFDLTESSTDRRVTSCSAMKLSGV